MGIEIPGGGAGTDVVSGIGSVQEPAGAVETAEVDAATASARGDAVARVADDLAAGRIDGNEAVELLMAEVLQDPIVKAAPDALRAELAEALSALLETDPHLQSLARSLGAESER
ncbi:MAG TPA: hypothetical protein VM285_13680 [Polyangia bacterium]|nr:hypothetical protein [Polyangia bacterium]